MYVVTNRIDLKAGYAKKMAPMFTKNSGIKEMKGFVRTEDGKLITKNLMTNFT